MDKEWYKLTREQQFEKRLEEKDIKMEFQKACYESVIRQLENKLDKIRSIL